jgi:hypothetical protein
MSLFFSRHTKLYLVQNNQADGLGTDNVWEIPVLDGFSFSQAINSSEVTLNEMESAGVSRRGRQVFNDSFAPAEWSFSTYVRPIISVVDATGGWEATGVNNEARHHAVEESLWANFAAVNNWLATDAWTNAITSSTSNMVIDFNESQTASLGEFSLIFTLGGCAPGGTPIYYELTNACVNSVSIDFEIDGIATLNWSGYAKSIAETTQPTATLYEGIADTDNFIRNRLTTLTCQAGDDDAQGTGSPAAYTTFPGVSNNGLYSVPLTGGSISFENNLTFLTPEELCKVNYPLRHVSGTRTVGGNFTCYLSDGTGESADLFNDLAAATTVVTNVFTLTFAVGGATAPYVSILVPQAHLEIPSHSIEDVIAVDVNFSGLPSNLDTPDEATITYVGA